MSDEKLEKWIDHGKHFGEPRCQARLSRSQSVLREQCKNPAVEGSRWCKHHGRKKHHRALLVAAGARVSGDGRLGDVPAVYKKAMSRSLREAVDEMMERAPAEQVALYEELALMRHTALQAVVLYDAALQTNKSELVANASQMLREALREVADMAQACSRVEQSSQDKLSLTQVSVIIDQIVRVAYDVFGGEQEDLQKVTIFAEAIKHRVKLPTLENRGTTITPDQDVLEMDATVPAR